MSQEQAKETGRPFAERVGFVDAHLDEANEELLGLHHVGALTYAEYIQVANVLVDARQKLHTLMKKGKLNGL